MFYWSFTSPGADLRQKASSATLPERPPLPSLLVPPLPFSLLSLRSRPLKYKGIWGSAVSSPSGVWGRAPAEIEFGAF